MAIPAVAGTWTPNAFLYEPSLGARGEVEKNLFDSGLVRVDSRLGKEIWVGDPLYGSTLQAAITAIGATPAILRVPAGTHPIAADLTIPATIALKPARGAVLAVPPTKTLTINGGLDAGLYQIFSCTGTGKVAFGGKVKEIFPEWWGITGTADNVAINAAIVAANGCKATVKLAGGAVYQLADQIFMANNTGSVAVEGYGAYINGSALNKPIFQISDFTGTGSVAQYIRLSGFCIYGAGFDAAAHSAHPLQDGLTIGTCSTLTVRDVKIINIPGVGINGKKAASGNRYWDSIAFYNVKVSQCGSSGMSIGRLRETDTDNQPADNIYLYNCTFTELCRGVNRGTTDNTYAGVYLASNLVAWFGGQVAAVGSVASPGNGAQFGLYTTSAVLAGNIESVHFERVGMNQPLSTDLWVSSSRGLVISGTIHSGNHADSAKTGIYLGGAQNVTVLNPHISGGSAKQYEVGVNVSNSKYCNVIGGMETDHLNYPCTSALVNTSANCVQCYTNVMGRTTTANPLNCQSKSPAIGVVGVYGASTSVVPKSGYVLVGSSYEQYNYQTLTPTRLKFVAGGLFIDGENVTARVTVTYNDGTTANVTHVFTDIGTYWLTDDEITSLLADNKYIKSLAYDAKSDQNTKVTLACTAYCLQ
jgi:hypothetical protein